MTKKILNPIFVAFATFWIIFTLVEYLRNHSTYVQSILDFSYWDLLGILLLVASIFLVMFSKAKNWSKFSFSNLRLNGFKIYALITLFAISIFMVFGYRTELFNDFSILSATGNFLLKYLYLTVGLYLITLMSFSIGNRALTLLKIEAEGVYEFIYSVASGIFIIVNILIILGIFGLLNGFVIWPILLILTGLSYKSVVKFIKSSLWTNFDTFSDIKIGIRHVFFLLVLITTITVNLISLIQPFPIGWDSINAYMNTAHLISEYGGLISGADAYNWSVFMSLGFTMFKSPEIALGISFLGGIFSMFAIYGLAIRFVPKKSAYLLILIFYTLPSIVFQSSKDLKVDLGLLFITFVIFNLLFDWLKMNAESRIPNVEGKVKNSNKKKKKNTKNKHLNTDQTKSKIKTITTETNFVMYKLIVLMGLLSGFAFGIKYTSFILVISVLTAIAYKYLKYAGIGIILSLSMISIFVLKLYKFSGILFNQQTIIVISSLLGLVLIASLVYLVINKIDKDNILNFIKAGALYTFTILIAFSPWLAFNYSNAQSIEVQSLLYGRGESVGFNLNKANKEYDQKFKELDAIEKSSNTEKNEANIPSEFTGDNEAVTRYVGYDPGATRFLTLPYDTIMNSNVTGVMVDIGYLLIVVLPIMFFLVLRKKSLKAATGLLVFSTLFVLLLSFLSVNGTSQCESGEITNQCVWNSLKEYQSGVSVLTSWIYYIPLALVLLLTLIYRGLGVMPESVDILVVFIFTLVPNILLYWYYKDNSKVKFLTILNAVYIFLWFLLGSGIYWYGLAGFLILFLYIFILDKEKYEDLGDIDKDKISMFLKYFSYFCIYLWIFLAFFNVFSQKRPGDINIFAKPFAEYMAGGNTSSVEALRGINPAYAEAVEAINADPESHVYKAGTLLIYFIEENNKRVLHDNRLDIFKTISDSSNSQAEITEKIYSQGYKYLVVDLNIDTIDQTENQTLTGKTNQMEEFLTDNPRLKLISTDRFIRDDENGTSTINLNGEDINVSRGFDGETIRKGSIATFEILSE